MSWCRGWGVPRPPEHKPNWLHLTSASKNKFSLNQTTLCECDPSVPSVPQALSIPISGVNPRSLPGVVVDIKHSAIVIPSFLPARGQRQLRALPPLTAADPRHRVGMLRGLEPSALLFIPPTPPGEKKYSRSSQHYN